MNEENKYYTPELSEFFIGFEYERRDTDIWHKCKFNGYDFSDVHTLMNKAQIGVLALECKTAEEFERRKFELPFAEKLNKQLILNNPNIYKNRIRVQFLDKEDIESLGWNYDKTYSGLNEDMFTTDDFILDYDYELKFCRIYYRENNGDITRFSGYIKNKSELKRIMQQVGI